MSTSDFTPNRRQLLQMSGLGFGTLALSSLLQAEEREPKMEPRSDDLRPRLAHHSGQARAVILLMQNGGPSQMDLFDPKPELTRRSGQTHSVTVETFQK